MLSATDVFGKTSLIFPQSVARTGTLQYRDSYKTFGDPSLSDEIIKACALLKREPMSLVSGCMAIVSLNPSSFIKFFKSSFNCPLPTNSNFP